MNGIWTEIGRKLRQAFNLTCHGRAELSQPQESNGEDGIAYDVPIGREEHKGVCVDGEVENQEEIEQVEVGERDGPAQMTMTGLCLTRKRGERDGPAKMTMTGLYLTRKRDARASFDQLHLSVCKTEKRNSIRTLERITSAR
jgi:hypothetical protein